MWEMHKTWQVIFNSQYYDEQSAHKSITLIYEKISYFSTQAKHQITYANWTSKKLHHNGNKLWGVFGKIAYWAILAYFYTNRGLDGQTNQC